ncbi:MAG: shikimate dehydrogenase [Lewinella sp.]|nr:shikimate dehydrogenase [Lewinella sp.]
MPLFGLIGYPLTHSFSQRYFTEKFRQLGLVGYAYENFPLATVEDFADLLTTHPDLRGINVTIPYKQQVMRFLDELDPAARAIGAVNTIDRRGGRLRGYNTDVIGFGNSLDHFLATTGGEPNAALILGTGGAALGVAWVLQQRGIAYQSVSRVAGEGRLSYETLTGAEVEEADLIINTTPLGMAPHVNSYPNIPYQCLTARHRLYDLIYNPGETVFLQRGRERGAATLNGLDMLYGQAEAAWAIWQSQG